ncbi:MAG: hypothetical protein ACREME_09450 [Gemmatimonadales bacterium]
MAEKHAPPPSAIRRIEEIQQFVRSVEHVKKLVTELEANRAAKQSIIDGLSSTIARELSQMRQRALSANVGTLADVAGSLAVVAGRVGGGLNMKLRALNEGVGSLMMQLDQSLKAARQPDKPKEPTTS